MRLHIPDGFFAGIDAVAAHDGSCKEQDIQSGDLLSGLTGILPIKRDLLSTSDVLYRSMQPSKNFPVRWTAFKMRFFAQPSLVSPSQSVWNISGCSASIASMYWSGVSETFPDLVIIETSLCEWNHWYWMPVSRKVANVMWSSRAVNAARPFLNARNELAIWIVFSKGTWMAFWSLLR